MCLSVKMPFLPEYAVCLCWKDGAAYFSVVPYLRAYAGRPSSLPPVPLLLFLSGRRSERSVPKVAALLSSPVRRYLPSAGECSVLLSRCGSSLPDALPVLPLFLSYPVAAHPAKHPEQRLTPESWHDEFHQQQESRGNTG